VQKRALRIIYADGINSDYQILLIIAGIDTLKDRREVLCERFLRDMFYLLAHYFIIYFLIAVTMTLLVASDMLNPFTQFGHEQTNFAIHLYRIH